MQDGSRAAPTVGRLLHYLQGSGIYSSRSGERREAGSWQHTTSDPMEPDPGAREGAALELLPGAQLGMFLFGGRLRPGQHQSIKGFRVEGLGGPPKP